MTHLARQDRCPLSTMTPAVTTITAACDARPGFDQANSL